MKEDKELIKGIEKYIETKENPALKKELSECAKYFVEWERKRILKNSIPAYQETNKYGNKQLHSWPGLCELDELEEGEEVKITIIK